MTSPAQRRGAWWQLLRIGNAPTAASNVIAGFLIAQGDWQPWGMLAGLVLASVLLYEAGMVLNDVYDAETDAIERPERPIPAGKISRRAAMIVGWALLALGLLAAGAVSLCQHSSVPIAVGLVLAMAIVGYDLGLKNTALGPWTMGACRWLNVLLGASAASSFCLAAWGYAGMVGLYTVGISYFARSENEKQKTSGHVLGNRFVTAATAGLLFFPLLLDTPLATPGKNIWHSMFWGFCWLIVAVLLVAIPKAAEKPTAFRQRVTRLLQGFILLDALVVFAAAGRAPALFILALLLPTRIASRHFPMT